jgi:hypothetical protein
MEPLMLLPFPAPKQPSQRDILSMARLLKQRMIHGFETSPDADDRLRELYAKLPEDAVRRIEMTVR